MAGWIKVETDTSNYSADIHRNSGVLTYGNRLCPGQPSNCSPYFNYTVKAIIEQDTSNFDDFHQIIDKGSEVNDIELSVTAKGCNQEGLIMWFNDGTSNRSYRVLDDNSIFDIKNVDDCDYIVIGKPLTGTQNFNTGSSSQGHKIKYRTTSDTIPSNFFTGSTDLVELYFPHMYRSGNNEGKNTKTIGSYAFSGCTKLSAVTFSNVETIEEGAFNNCTSISKIDWGHSGCTTSKLKTIGNYAFQNCRSITSLNLPNTLKVIGNSGFYNCSGLTTVTVPDSVTTIGERCFTTCDNLTSITIGSGVTSIGERCFSNNSSLTSFTIKATTPPTLASNSLIFYQSSNVTIYVPSGSVNTYKAATGWSSYENKIQAIP